MHSSSRQVRRKQRYQSEPPPSRPSVESPSDSGDEAIFHDAEGDDSRRELLNAQARPAAFATKSRGALHSQTRTTFIAGDKGRTTTATTAPSVAFPLTPTSAAEEATDRTMASLTAAAEAVSAAAANETKAGGESANLSGKPVRCEPQDKMNEQSTINDPSPHPPPSSAPVTKNTDPSSPANTVRASPSHSQARANGFVPSPSSAPRTMSHRVENQTIRPRHFQDQHFHDSHYYSAHPSPPPITTLTHSPSLSSDRSSVNSPAPTILPPLTHTSQFQPQPYIARYPVTAQPGIYHHSHYYPNTVSPPEVFTTPAQSYAYSGGYAAPPPPTHVPFHHTTDMSMSPSQPYSVNPYATTGSLYGHGGHGGGGSGGFTPIYTDDASTKLSDRVRRRCFNCCTTDTSTWRRSSLNPGKVLCNKCGLFERTHSRPRPDQFPHKRAPLQIPTQGVAHDAVNAAQSMNSPQSHAQAGHGSNPAPQTLPPTPGHPSLGATYSNPSALPQIQEWLRPNSNSGSGAANHAGTGSSSASSSASAGPSSRAHSASSAADGRHHPYASSVPASGAGDSRSPQGFSARLAKRSNSVTSDMVGTPPPRRSTQNLTPSPSPPPTMTQPGGTVSSQELSPRVPPQVVGTDSENP